MQRVDWKRGSSVVPADRQFHQHFNTGATPARYLALRWGSKKYPVFKKFGIDVPTTQGGDQVEYYDEDLGIIPMLKAELARSGPVSKLDDVMRRRPREAAAR